MFRINIISQIQHFFSSRECLVNCLSRLESREYQNVIVNRIKELVLKNNSVILELDCGMGKRVLSYRLLTEVFSNKKIVFFLQTHSSLQETVHYLTNEYGGVNGLSVIKSGLDKNYRKYLLENNRVILTLPTVFLNTIKSFPELAGMFEIAIINEVDEIVRRFTHRNVLCVPWSKLIPSLTNAMFIGMSGTLRDDHLVLDESQLQLRKELSTISEFIPNSALITIEEFIGTDLRDYIKYSEVHILPVKDSRTAEVILKLTALIDETKEEIMHTVREFSPQDFQKLRQNFFQQLPFLSIETELVEKFNRLLLLRKYVYSMPANTYRNYLIRYGFDENELQELPPISGKETIVIKMAKKHNKTAVLCSFLSTVNSLTKQLEKENIRTFQVTGKIKNKNTIINNFKEAQEQSALILSPVGERDIDIPQTDLLIVYDLVNSPKTVYQKMKRSRGGKVALLFYEDTPERGKVKQVVSEIAVRYPWSLIFTNNKESARKL